MKSGMLAAEAVYQVIMDAKQQESKFPEDESQQRPYSTKETTMGVNGDMSMTKESMTHTTEAESYETALHASWIADELKVARNSHASFHSPLGLAGGMIHTALSCFITQVRKAGGRLVCEYACGY
jgi:flavin-dependent dehydrogenase